MKCDADFADDILSKTLKCGADEAEVFIRSRRNISVEVKDQAVESLSSSFSSGYAVRVIKNRRLGFSFSTDMTDPDRVISRAIAAAQSADEDRDLGLPGALSAIPEVCTVDPAIQQITEDDAIRHALQIEEAAYAADQRIKRVRKPSASFTQSGTLIANSHGLKTAYEATACSGQITAIAEADGESQSGWDFAGSRFLGDISYAQIGISAAASAARLLGSRKMKGRKADIILDNSVAVDFLGVFASSLSSEAVQKGKSLLAGSFGTQVISRKLNIIDTGILPGKLGSRPVDDEGVAVQAKSLIHEGVLLSFLYNTYTAKKGNTASTGNAIRGSFAGLPGIGITNLYIEPAASADVLSQEMMFSAIGSGLYIVDAMGIHTVNPISGDFSVGVSGLWIENGAVAFPVREAIISGNLLDFFGKTAAVADDLRFYGNVGSPSLIMADIDVSS